MELDGGLTGDRGGSARFDARSRFVDIGVETVEGFRGVTPIDVAERDDVLAGEIDEVGAAHATDADAGDVEGVAGRNKAAAENVTRHDGEGDGSYRRVGEQFATRDGALFGHGVSVARSKVSTCASEVYGPRPSRCGPGPYVEVLRLSSSDRLRMTTLSDCGRGSRDYALGVRSTLRRADHFNDY